MRLICAIGLGIIGGSITGSGRDGYPLANGPVVCNCGNVVEAPCEDDRKA